MAEPPAEIPQQLREYFEGETLEVLSKMSVSQLMSVVDKSDRVCLSTFLSAGGFTATNTAPKQETNDPFQTTVLSLKGQATSERFKSYGENHLSKVLSLRTSNDTLRRQAVVLDLRSNNLFDEDLGLIAIHLESARYPQLRYLLLQDNRFDTSSAKDAAGALVQKMLDRYPDLTIAITGNPLATIAGCNALFKNVRLTQSKRLIFIHEVHLTRERGWSIVFKENLSINDEALDHIETSHTQFYSAMKDMKGL